jgi:ATP-dependent Clp protease protease subunit
MSGKKERDRKTLEDRGILYLSGSIESGGVEALSRQIIELNLNGALDCIQLLVNSPGGEVSAGFALIDIMDWSRLPVYTTGLGMLGSMGLLVFMAGEKGHRVLTERVSVLSHRYSWWCMGTHSELLARRKEEDLIHRRILDHYLRHTGLASVEELQKTLLRDVDTWLTAREAVELGIADVVEGQPLTVEDAS